MVKNPKNTIGKSAKIKMYELNNIALCAQNGLSEGAFDTNSPFRASLALWCKAVPKRVRGGFFDRLCAMSRIADLLPLSVSTYPTKSQQGDKCKIAAIQHWKYRVHCPLLIYFWREFFELRIELLNRYFADWHFFVLVTFRTIASISAASWGCV
jgi:hypothetical protein